MKIYVVSLEKAVERRQRVASVLFARGIEFEFFNAVNGFDGLPERLLSGFVHQGDVHAILTGNWSEVQDVSIGVLSLIHI